LPKRDHQVDIGGISREVFNGFSDSAFLIGSRVEFLAFCGYDFGLLLKMRQHGYAEQPGKRNSGNELQSHIKKSLRTF